MDVEAYFRCPDIRVRWSKIFNRLEISIIEGDKRIELGIGWIVQNGQELEDNKILANLLAEGIKEQIPD